MDHNIKVPEETINKKKSWIDVDITEEEIMEDLNYGRSSLEDPKTSCLNWSCNLGNNI